MYAGSSRTVSSVSLSSVGFRDGPWERALLALPDQLLSALRAGELDDPGVLCEYPRMTAEELYAWLREKLGEDGALSGATSPAQFSTTSCGSGTAMPLSLTVPSRGPSTATNLDGLVVSVVSVGGDPKSDHASLTGGDPKTDHASYLSTGGDRKTDHASLVSTGGDPRTDLASFGNDAVSGVSIAATYSPERQGSWHPKLLIPALLLSALILRSLMTKNQVHFDGFPSTAEDLDELPDSTLDCESTAYTRIPRVAEKSEEVRQSDFGVQNLPASVSSSELSPYQMGGSLAGSVQLSGMLQSEMDPAHTDGFSRLRLKSESVDPAHRDGFSNVSESAEGIFSEHCGGSQSQSIGIGTSCMLAIEGSGFLSISDRALLRRFGSLETPRKDLRT